MMAKDDDNLYLPGTYFALMFDITGQKDGIMYGRDLEQIETELRSIQEVQEMEYVILQVVRNPRNKRLH